MERLDGIWQGERMFLPSVPRFEAVATLVEIGGKGEW